MKNRMIPMMVFVFGILLLAIVAWGIYREVSVRSQDPVVKMETQPVIGEVDTKPTATEIPVQDVNPIVPTEIPVHPLRNALSSGSVALIIDRGDGYAVTSVWGLANFYREDVPVSVSMSYESGGIETLESSDGTLFTQVHSGYYYSTKLFAADIVNYVWSPEMYLSDGQAMVRGLVGKIGLLCQSTDGTILPLQAVDTANCPNQKMVRITSAAIIDHSYVEQYSQSVMSISDWMAAYEESLPDFSTGFGERKATWIVSTCLNQYLDQPSDGNSYLYGRLVIGFEPLGEQ